MNVLIQHGYCVLFRGHFKNMICVGVLTANTDFTHYSDAIIGPMASQITSFTIVYSTVSSGPDQRKYQSSASLAFVRGIHRGPVNSPHKWPVTRKMFPFDDVIMYNGVCRLVFIAGATRLHLNSSPPRQNDHHFGRRHMMGVFCIDTKYCFHYNGACRLLVIAGATRLR